MLTAKYEYALSLATSEITIDNVPIMFRAEAQALVEEQSELLKYARNRKWREIKGIRNRKETSGCPFKGSVIDSDERSVTKINTAVQSAQIYGEKFSIDWTMQDNSVMTLDYADMLSVPLALAAWSNYLHQHARKIRTQIDLAENITEIMVIGWSEDDFDSVTASVNLGDK